MTGIIGYWFAASWVLPHGDGRPVVIGETLHVDPPLELCRRGLHASRQPFDALQYASGPLLFKVRLSGEVLEDEDKMCASERTALAMVDATELLRLFARQATISMLHLWDAPEVVRRYLETGDESIRVVARDVARAVRDATAANPEAWRAKDRVETTRKMFNDMVEEAFAS